MGVHSVVQLLPCLRNVERHIKHWKSLGGVCTGSVRIAVTTAKVM